MGAELYAKRVHVHKAPLEAIYWALTAGREFWLRLQPGEVAPKLLEEAAPSRVIWSSLWPVSPDDIIEFDLSVTAEGATALRFRWSSASPPDERGIAITRQRLNRKFGGTSAA